MARVPALAGSVVAGPADTRGVSGAGIRRRRPPPLAAAGRAPAVPWQNPGAPAAGGWPAPVAGRAAGDMVRRATPCRPAVPVVGMATPAVGVRTMGGLVGAAHPAAADAPRAGRANATGPVPGEP